MIRPGYAVEYDYVPARYIYKTYENKNIHSLYGIWTDNDALGTLLVRLMAPQATKRLLLKYASLFCGESMQGIMAGINAALSIRKEQPFILNRSEAFLGVCLCLRKIEDRLGFG